MLPARQVRRSIIDRVPAKTLTTYTVRTAGSIRTRRGLLPTGNDGWAPLQPPESAAPHVAVPITETLSDPALVTYRVPVPALTTSPRESVPVLAFAGADAQPEVSTESQAAESTTATNPPSLLM